MHDGMPGAQRRALQVFASQLDEDLRRHRPTLASCGADIDGHVELHVRRARRRGQTDDIDGREPRGFDWRAVHGAKAGFCLTVFAPYINACLLYTSDAADE